jgi:sensor domain CHASE-containing protein
VLRKTSVFSACVFVATLLLGFYWNQLNQALQQREQASLVRDLINTQASSVERLLNLSLLSTELLAHEVRRSQGEPPDFAARAAEILRDFPSVSSLQLAPGGINLQIFPFAGNEAAKGVLRNIVFLGFDVVRIALIVCSHLQRGLNHSVFAIPFSSQALDCAGTAHIRMN